MSLNINNISIWGMTILGFFYSSLPNAKAKSGFIFIYNLSHNQLEISDLDLICLNWHHAQAASDYSLNLLILYLNLHSLKISEVVYSQIHQFHLSEYHFDSKEFLELGCLQV